jgi:hypothetical protein
MSRANFVFPNLGLPLAGYIQSIDGDLRFFGLVNVQATGFFTS